MNLFAPPREILLEYSSQGKPLRLMAKRDEEAEEGKDKKKEKEQVEEKWEKE